MTFDRLTPPFLSLSAIPEAEKKLASSKDLLQAHLETAQRKLKTASFWCDQRSRFRCSPTHLQLRERQARRS
jgi:hypothetical protein